MKRNILNLIFLFFQIPFGNSQECFFFLRAESEFMNFIPEEIKNEQDSTELVIYIYNGSRNINTREIYCSQDSIYDKSIRIRGFDTIVNPANIYSVNFTLDSLHFVDGIFELGCRSSSSSCNIGELQFIYLKKGLSFVLLFSRDGCLFDAIEKYPFYFSAYNHVMNYICMDSKLRKKKS